MLSIYLIIILQNKPCSFCCKECKLCGYLILWLFVFVLLHIPLGIGTFSFHCISTMCVTISSNQPPLLTSVERVPFRSLQNHLEPLQSTPLSKRQSRSLAANGGVFKTTTVGHVRDDYITRPLSFTFIQLLCLTYHSF